MRATDHSGAYKQKQSLDFFWGLNKPGSAFVCTPGFQYMIFDRPEIVDIGGLSGPGRPEYLPKRKPPTF